MEVHSHTHSEGKKWTHYLWEFLMLFLAVFCGFLAENFREHSVEHHRAKEFAKSLLADFNSDTAALHIAIQYGKLKMSGIDSFFSQAVRPVNQWSDTLVYRYSGMAVRVRPFARNSGTYEQMKASGSLRYFRQELADLLNQYDVQARKSEAREDILLKYNLDYLSPLQDKIIDRRPMIQMQDGLKPGYPLSFRNLGKETISLWINYSAVVQGTQKRTLDEYEVMLSKAKAIIQGLKNEYRLD